MKSDRVVLDFGKKSVPQMIEFGRLVSSQMKGNTNFPTPDVPIAELDAATDLLEERSTAAKNGGKEATALLHQAIDDWYYKMRREAKYVDRIADGDGAIIFSAGFNIAKQPSLPVRPEFSVELGERSGTVTIRRQAVEGARSYIWQYCIGEMPAPLDSDWVTAQVTTKVTVELTGLTPLTKYWFRCAAVLVSETAPYNAPVMQIVL